MKVPRSEWIKTGIVFHDADGLNAYGLKAIKGATKAFQLVLQAYIIKHLLFEGKQSKKNTKWVAFEELIKKVYFNIF